MNLIVEELPGTKATVNTCTETVTFNSLAPELQTPVAPNTPAPSRAKIQLPGPGREISEFAAEVGAIMKPKRVWFIKADQVVEIRHRQFSRTVRSVVFHPLTANETRTVLEQHLQTGHWRKTREGEEFVSQSTSAETAAALLASPQLKGELPVIERILDVPIPYLDNSRLVFAARGYDERLNTYCRPDAPEIRSMSLEEAKRWLHELQRDFCFADSPSVTISTARLLTPLCRGLMGWESRPPVWIFEGNRPRAGKDYLAGCTGVLYEGRVNEDTPLETEGEETKKRIMAALQSGRRFMHFANCQGYVQNAAFEHAATAKVISGRNLGRSDAASDVTLPNEIEFSLSANSGFSFTEDFNLRCRKISLQYSQEDANSRTFTHPDLHGWVLEHRSDLLSALAALIQHWHEQGQPCGPTPFTSFPEWSRVVGGIMTCCGLGDPCAAQNDGTLTGDNLSGDMKKLFQIAQEQFQDKPITRHEIYRLLDECQDGELFGWWDLKEKSGQSIFGKKLRQFSGRILGGIQLTLDEQDQKRPRFRFSRRVVTLDARVVDELFDPTSQTSPKCPPCPPCPPLPRSLATHLIGNRPPEVPKVDMVDIQTPQTETNIPILVEKSCSLPGGQVEDVNNPPQTKKHSDSKMKPKEPGMLEKVYGITPAIAKAIIQAHHTQEAREQNLEDQSTLGRSSFEPSTHQAASRNETS